jgi:hypothetical protein
MSQSRRQFLSVTATIFSGSIFSGSILVMRLDPQPQSRKMPSPPEPAETKPHAQDDSSARIRQRTIMQQHEKQFRDSLADLSERVSQLKEQVQELHATEVFSVKIYKQTSEIERLAKQLKNLAKN